MKDNQAQEGDLTDEQIVAMFEPSDIGDASDFHRTARVVFLDEAVALVRRIYAERAANVQPKGTATISATELAEMWRRACADWNDQVGASPDPWEHFATRLSATRQPTPPPATWQAHASKWLRDKAEAQRKTNAQYPRHVACYPSWEKRVRDLDWLAEELERDAAQAQAPAPAPEGYKQALGSKNCMQSAVAYMLGLPMDAVPDFEKAAPDAWESFYSFIAERGFTAEMFPPNVEIEGDYLASGSTERGTSHMVVMRGGKLLHDPHPSNAGLTALQVVWVIARKAGPAPAVKDRP